MSKTKKSKLLASMLCATVVAGLYAGPVMAGDGSINAGEGAVNEGKGTGIKITIDKLHNAGGDINTDPGLFIDHQPLTNEYKVFGNLEITADQLAAGIKGSDVEFGKVTADTLNVGGKDVVKLNGSRVDVNADVINGGFLKVTNANGEMVFAVDSKGVVKAANGNFGIADDGTVSVGGDETNGKAIINGTTGDITTKGNVYAVNGSFDNITTGTITAANGSFKVDQGNGETVVAGSMIYSKNQNGSYGMLNGNQLTLQGDGNKFSVVNGNVETSGTVTASKDVVANGISLVDVGEKTTALEEKTQDISYENGKTTVGGVTFNNGFVDASVVKTHSVFFDGGTLSAGGISAVQGKFVVDENGSVKSFGDVQSANYSLEEIGKNLGDLETGVSADLSDLKQKTSTLTVIEGTSKGTITNISSHLNVQGDISANGDVTTKAGASLNGLKEQVTEDAVKINNLQVNTAGITRDGAVTTIEGATSFDADGMKMVGDNVTEFVNINKDGSMAVSNGDASFYFNKNNIALNNGNNSIMVGNESITLSTTGAALTMSKDGLDYADGAFKVATDGSVRIASGTENSITLDAKTGVIYANDFSTGEYSLNAIGDQLTELETGVSETNKNVAGITRKGEVTTIEGATSFDANGMKVGNNVTINKDGSMEARNGDASMYFNDGNISLNNGTNSVMVGNNSITLDADGTALTMNHDGLDYADGAFTVRNDGTVYANGSMTADDFITKDGIKLSEVNAKLDDLEGSVGETNKNTAGIKRDELTETTTIEGATSFDKTGMTIEGVTGTTSIVGGQATFMGQNGFTQIMGGNIQTDSINGVNFDDLVNRVEDLEDKTQNITGSEPGTGEGGSTVPPTTGGETGIEGDVTVGGGLTAGSGNIGGVTMEDGKVTAGEGNFSDKVTVGGENGTSIDKDGVNVGGENGTSITDKDVVINQGTDNEVSLSDVGNRVDNLEQGMASMSNRISKVEDRIDKVGAMSAAIANLRTMGYDPTAPTEIAVGIGQYKSETGAALGLFHYPNKDFMLSLSVSTSGDEVMGGIGATWKFGRKSPEQMLAAEKEKAAKAKLAKAEAMKKAAAEAKVAEQQAKHAKMAAEKAAK